MNPANQHLYLYVKIPATWHAARDYCAERGGHLVTIQAPSENLFVYNLATDNNRLETWLGATDEGREGTWGWITGEPWNYENWDGPDLSKAHPVARQPDDKHPTTTGLISGADFLAFQYGDRTWQDVGNQFSLYLVCEWEPTESLPTEITDAKGVEMVHVPAGEFTMGSDSDAHTVYLDAYYIDKYEVTNALYKACVDAGICDPPKESRSQTRSSYYGNSLYGNLPVIKVDWFMADKFCKWRGAQLPTEAQWEKAARGNDSRWYPWGNEDIDCGKANYRHSFDYPGYCVGDTTTVGSYESGVSPYGVYDMVGNVAEWVADFYDPTYYANSSFNNPTGPSSGGQRVFRGDSWSTYGNVTTIRRGYNPSYSFNDLGFRCSHSP